MGDSLLERIRKNKVLITSYRFMTGMCPLHYLSNDHSTLVISQPLRALNSKLRFWENVRG
jgi:hypothetical protein